MPITNWRNPAFARRCGLSHIEKGARCQDYVDVYDTAEYTIAALADGVGSRDFSELAATEAVNGTIQWFMENGDRLGSQESPDPDISRIRNMLLELRYRIKGAAKDRKLDLSQMDCNLAFVFIRKNPAGEDRVYYGVLGDCAVCEIGTGDRMETLCGATADDNATDSVMSPNSAANFRIRHRYVEQDDIRGFLLTSDGLEHIAYVKRSGYVYHGAEDYYNAIFAKDPKQRIDDLFRELQKNPSFFDDLSVAVLSRDEQPRTFRRDPYWLCTCEQKNPIYALVCSKCSKDYLDLYHDLDKDLRKGGYKNAFEYFLYMNQHPDQERNRLGLAPEAPRESKPAQTMSAVKAPAVKQQEAVKTPPVKKAEKTGKAEASSVDNYNEETGKSPTGPTEDPVVMKPENPKKRSLLKIILSAAAILLILINTVISGMNLLYSRGFHSMKSDLLDRLENIYTGITSLSGYVSEQNDSQEPVETYKVVLDDGSVYYGEVLDGVPHGSGVVYGEDTVSTGTFSNGKKNGQFLVRSLEEPQELSIVRYVMDTQIGEPLKIGYFAGREDMLASCVTMSEVTVYADYAEEEAESWQIPANTLIYLTGEYASISQVSRRKAELWIQICSADGISGWCRASELGMYQQ